MASIGRRYGSWYRNHESLTRTQLNNRSTTRWNKENQTSLTITSWNHIQHFTLTFRKALDNRTLVFFWSVDLNTFKWLTFNTINFFTITSGRDTWSSYPSRRIVSIRIDKCNSPRPETVHLSGESVGSTRRETSVCNSACKRSSTLREVTHLPSLPANGELLTKKVIWRVGSSMCRIGRASTASVGVMVSPTKISSIPETAIKSPALASWFHDVPNQRNQKFCNTEVLVVPSSLERVTCPQP